MTGQHSSLVQKIMYCKGLRRGHFSIDFLDLKLESLFFCTGNWFPPAVSCKALQDAVGIQRSSQRSPNHGQQGLGPSTGSMELSMERGKGKTNSSTCMINDAADPLPLCALLWLVRRLSRLRTTNNGPTFHFPQAWLFCNSVNLGVNSESRRSWDLAAWGVISKKVANHRRNESTFLSPSEFILRSRSSP